MMHQKDTEAENRNWTQDSNLSCKRDNTLNNNPNSDQYEGFSISLALIDLLPVILFCCSCMVISHIFKSTLFFIGSLLCIIAGCGKVLWKLVISMAHKNIWLLNRQLRVLMPAGFLLILISLIVDRENISLYAIWSGITGFPSVLIFLIGIVGIVLMTIYAKKMDAASVRANWIEQITNTIPQAAFLIGLLLIG